MKTQVSHHTTVTRNLTLILAGSLFLLVVFFSQYHERKAKTMNGYSETIVDRMTSVTAFETIGLTAPSTASELMAETVEMVTVDESVFILEEHAEAELAVTDWMLDGSSWGVADEFEHEPILADWMLSSEPWEITESEVSDLVILEEWMLQTTLLNTADEAMMVDEQEEVVFLQPWMLTSEAWLDYQQQIYPSYELEPLITGTIE